VPEDTSKRQPEAKRSERKHLKALLENYPTPTQKTSAAERIDEIDNELKIEGYLSSKFLQPPE